MMKRKYSVKAWCKLIMLAAVVIFSSAGVATGADDTIRVGLNAEPSTLNVMALKTNIDIVLAATMYQGLMRNEYQTGKRIMHLAESIKVMENGKDLRIKLIKTARFHNGDPLTAHDVKFSYEEAVNPKNANILSGPLDEIEEIELLDDYNLIFRFYEPYAPWLELMTLGIVPKKVYQKVGRKKFRKHPIGSGPLRFVSQTLSEIVLEAVENHHNFQPAFKRIKLLFIKDSFTRVAMLEVGELDLIYEITPHQIKRLKQLPNIRIKTNDNIPSFYGLATKPALYPIMRDKKLKLAMNHGINRQEIVDRVFLKYGYPMYMYANKIELGYDPEFKYEFDLEKAKRLVQESSYKPGTPLTLTYTSNVPNSAMVAALIQAYMKRIGITIKLQQLEFGVQATYTRARDRREGHMTLYYWAGERDPMYRLMLTVPSNSPYGSFPDRDRQKELNQLVKDQQHEMDPARRLQLLQQIHRYLNDEPSTISLFGLSQIYAMNKKIDYSWTDIVSYLVYLYRIQPNP